MFSYITSAEIENKKKGGSGMVITRTIKLNTKGNNDMKDITGEIVDIVHNSGINSGIVNIFVVGSTGAITTIEYEPGLIKDLPEAMDRIAPDNLHYSHDDTWGDHNGHSHIRASILGPSLTIPFTDKQLHLGTWQQIVLIEFDVRPRQRIVIVKIIGE